MYKKQNNKKGYTIFLIMISILIIIFWRLSSNSFELISIIKLQKIEMKNCEIKLEQNEIINIELNN